MPAANDTRKKKAKSKQETKVDLRKLPIAERPKPTTGQSAKLTMTWDQFGADERDVIMLLNNKFGEVYHRRVSFLANGLEGDNVNLRARNALRRPVASKWVSRVSRGLYQITAKGRRQLSAALAA